MVVVAAVAVAVAIVAATGKKRHYFDGATFVRRLNSGDRIMSGLLFLCRPPGAKNSRQPALNKSSSKEYYW